MRPWSNGIDGDLLKGDHCLISRRDMSDAASVLASLAGVTGLAEFANLVFQSWRVQELGDSLEQAICPDMSKRVVTPLDSIINWGIR